MANDSLTRVPKKAWWKELVIYQIYPASFVDTTGSGTGDIAGIISKLDYIANLGVTGVWLSPIFESPQKDMGYDISDYRSIHAPYGNVADVEIMIKGFHERGIKVLLDLVVNHTSDQHAWFKESASSRTNPKREWYFWRDPKFDSEGKRIPPNNWASLFGGSAWHYDESTEQYYLALFLPSQPDLNWTNEEMRRATYDDMEFWLQKGVDGFRIDSMNLMSKHPDLPDGKVLPGMEKERYHSGAEYFASGPRMHEHIREMRTQVFDRYDAMTVGELGFTKDEKSVAEYVAEERHELNCLFTGDIVDIDFGVEGKYGKGDFHVSKLREITNRWQTMMPKIDGWNTVYMDNHDSGRSLSRYASDKPEFRARAAKMLAMYMCSLPGTLFMLQGQEIGMQNCDPSWGIEEYIDVEGRNAYEAILRKRGEGADMSDVMRELRLKARDNGRLPMQWDNSPNGGFSKGKPWMRVNSDFAEWNVAAQIEKNDSVLGSWKHMLKLRKQEADVFIYGTFEMLAPERSGEDIFAFVMSGIEAGKKAIVVLNFSEREYLFAAQGFDGWKQLTGEHDDAILSQQGLRLKGYEGVIFCNWL